MLVAPATARDLVRVRALLVGVIGLRLLLRRWWTLVDRPASLFQPVPVVQWMGGPPSLWLVLGLWVAGLLAVGCTLARRAPAISFALAWFSLLLLTGWWGSSGKVMHNDLLLLTVAIPMLFARSPDATDVEAGTARTRWGWPPRASLVVLATIYCLTGIQKLRHSGLDWVFSDNLSWVIRQGSSPFGTGFSQLVADQGWLTRLFAAGTLLIELGAPVMLFFRRTRPSFALASFALHGSIWALMGLDYYAWILTTWAVALPLAVWPEPVERFARNGWPRSRLSLIPTSHEVST
ncbi:MAG: hypothetical protein ABIP03_14025 [Aquihabitans sp.]